MRSRLQPHDLRGRKNGWTDAARLHATATPTMTEPAQKPGVIRRDAVRFVRQPALVECATTGENHRGQPLTVVPLLDGDVVAGFEIRCGCGATAVVECVYQKEPA